MPRSSGVQPAAVSSARRPGPFASGMPASPSGSPGRPDLVARGQHGNHGAAMDGDLRDARPGGERDRRRAEPATRLEERGPLLEVAATRADRAAGFDRFVDETRGR